MTKRTTSAIVAHQPGRVGVAEVGIPQLGPRDVLVRSQFSGVSTGTDKWVMQGLFTWIPMGFPLVPGYQRYGAVDAIGEEVTDLVIGQHVVATESQPFPDAIEAWGGHVALGVTDRAEVFDATGIPGERASLIISAQVGYNAASRILPGRTHRVVVYGDGIIGASGALSARARGFDVLLVGRHADRLEPMSALGIATTLSGLESAATVRDWGPTVVIDTVQNEAAAQGYLDALPVGTGQLVFSGHSPGAVTAWADMVQLQKRELEVSFVSGWTAERVEATLALMRDGSLPLETLASVPASTPEAIDALMQEVVQSTLRPVAAVIDWRGLQDEGLS